MWVEIKGRVAYLVDKFIKKDCVATDWNELGNLKEVDGKEEIKGMTNLKNLREYYLVVKNINNKYYRFIKLEQGKDKSLYIHTMSGLKLSYHSNHGKMKSPYRFHYKGEKGKLIFESIDENRKKFISEYEGPFAQFNLLPFEKDMITQPTEEDIVYDIKDNEFSDYEVVFFSEKKSDLLNDECDNMISKKIEFESYNIIVGLYQRNKK